MNFVRLRRSSSAEVCGFFFFFCVCVDRVVEVRVHHVQKLIVMFNRTRMPAVIIEGDAVNRRFSSKFTVSSHRASSVVHFRYRCY